MSLMDDDSTTYRSEYTRMTKTLSETSERNSSRPQWLPDAVVSAASQKYSKNPDVVYRGVSNKERELEEEQEKDSSSEMNNNGGVHPSRLLRSEVCCQPLKAEGNGTDTNHAHAANAKGGAVENNRNSVENDDGTSSIEFAIDNETGRESGSPVPSSIVFARDSSSKSPREASVHPVRVSHDKGLVAGVAAVGSAAGCGSSGPHGVLELTPGEVNKSTERCTSGHKKRVKDMGKISSWALDPNTKGLLVYTGRKKDEKEKRMWNNNDNSTGRGRSCSDSGSGKDVGSLEGKHSQHEGRLRPHSRRSSKESSSTMDSQTYEPKYLIGSGSSSRRGAPLRSTSQEKKNCKKPVAYNSPSRRSYLLDHTSDYESKRGERCKVRGSPHRGNNSVLSSQLQGTPLRATRYTSPALERFKEYRMRDSPLRMRSKKKEEILAMLDEEMELVRNEMRESDMAMEYVMLRNPFERLYHMNNRRDRDERRCRILHYMKLEEAKRRLLVETEEDDERRREWRREYERRQEEVFDRLYYISPTRLDNSNMSHTQNARNETYVANSALFDRLYNEALESILKKRALARKAEKDREQKELDEILHARILARVELESPTGRLLTPEEREKRANGIQQKIMQSPEKLKKFLNKNRLSLKEEKLLSSRLTRHGFVDPAKLEKRKREKELEGCTFYPRVNECFNTRIDLPSGRYRKDTVSLSARRKSGEAGNTPVVSPRCSGSRTQKRACEQLYMKGLKQRERDNVVAQEATRQKKLAILKSRLKEDHHFRRRVELDPSLAERFMASLAV